MSFSKSNQRSTIIVMNSIIFVNVYLLTVKNDNDYDTIVDIISDINLIIRPFSHLPMVFGGDLNMNLLKKGRQIDLINDFIDRHELELCNQLINCSVEYIPTIMNHYKITVILIMLLYQRVFKITWLNSISLRML